MTKIQLESAQAKTQKACDMSHSKLYRLFGILLGTLCVLALPIQSQAAPKGKSKAAQAQKERLVLMPLRLGEEDQKLQGAMETALVEGLQQKYEVLSGEQVARKAREIFQKESRNTAKKECDETRCLQGITEAFNSELLAIASVTKQDGGYFLALSIRNLYDNIDVYSKSLPCEGCNAFQAVNKIKELIGTPAPVAAVPTTESPQPKVTATDPESITWAEAQKGNTVDDYQVYLDAYPQGKYVLFAKAKLKKLKGAEQASADQQEQLVWDADQKRNSIESIRHYLQVYPNGHYVDSATSRLNKLKADDPLSENRALEAAFGFYKTEHYQNAVSAFQEFLNSYPQSVHAANIRYWMGNAYFVLKDYKSSLESYQILVQKFDTHPKIVEALFSIADCQELLNDGEAARLTLKQVIARFPNSREADKAKKLLAKLN